LLARCNDGIAKQGADWDKRRGRLSWFSQSTSIVIENIDAGKRRNFPVDSRAKIFDGPAIGI
jgi:hypothetical protein